MQWLVNKWDRCQQCPCPWLNSTNRIDWNDFLGGHIVGLTQAFTQMHKRKLDFSVPFFGDFIVRTSYLSGFFPFSFLVNEGSNTYWIVLDSLLHSIFANFICSSYVRFCCCCRWFLYMCLILICWRKTTTQINFRDEFSYDCLPTIFGIGHWCVCTVVAAAAVIPFRDLFVCGFYSWANKCSVAGAFVLTSGSVIIMSLLPIVYSFIVVVRCLFRVFLLSFRYCSTRLTTCSITYLLKIEQDSRQIQDEA